MTQSNRILLNTIATYGRSVYALVVSLITARWTLQALGQVDYGLMGVVGGLTGFISFINGMFAVGVSRFYALTIGKEKVATDKNAALEDCRKWYSTAVFIHTVLPLILMLIGYPIGVWAVRNFLVIPVDRVNDCVWVFRFVCVTCFLGMVTVPINAMYTAKQYIAELTIYSFVTTTLNAFFLYYMVTHPAVWLARFAFWSCCLGVLPRVIISIRGITLFKECRFRLEYCISGKRFKEMFYYIGWSTFGQLGSLLRAQGIQILINKYFGPAVNASMAIANRVNSQTTTMSSAMMGAFQPAIVSAYGAGDLVLMRTLAFRATKFSLVLVLLFVIPLSLELREVLLLWLRNPPQYIYGLSLTLFASTLVHQSAFGHLIAVNAKGKIACYQSVLGSILLLSLPLAWIFCAMGCNVYYVCVALLLTMAASAWGRVLFARKLVGMSVVYWLKSIMLPIFVVSAIALLAGLVPVMLQTPSFTRIVITTIVCEVVFLPLVWLFILDDSERVFIKDRLFAVLRRIRGNGNG